NCQTKKIKCSGPPECTKCQEKNLACNFITERKKRGPAPKTKRDVIESLATRRAKIGYRPSSFSQKSYANMDNIIEFNLMEHLCINHISELENRQLESHTCNEIEENMNVEFLTPRTTPFSSLSSRPHHNPLNLFSGNRTSFNIFCGANNKKESKEDTYVHEVTIPFT
ncbi:43580_t:CDS:2, partial [Gigaspora margarita]